MTNKARVLHPSHYTSADYVWKQVAAWLPNGPLRVVDLGAGARRWTVEGYKKVVPVDIKTYNHQDTIIHDCNLDFPFNDKEFDGVVSIELIEHLENPYHFLRECARIAKSFIIIVTPNVECSEARRGWLGIDCSHQAKIRAYTHYGHRIIVPIWIFQCYAPELGWVVTKWTYTQPREHCLVVKMEPIEDE